jgi:serine/threonine-protein kinase
MSEINSGTIIDGRYRVLSRIGSGGMADVYLAEDELLSRQVAVKVLHHRFVDDQEFVERFRREASSAAAISHRNVVAIFDRGQWNDTYYIAMEYLPGQSLKALIRDRGALDADTAVAITIQILNAAQYAHSRGVVHRDIKPHNVILSDDGRVTVTDFGIAQAGGSDITHTGSIMGTAQYLSPEQAQGQPVTAASDIYAVGVLLYELLTGRVPFEGDSAVAIALQHLSAEPLPPSSLNPNVPAALDHVVLRALAKDPHARYPDAPQFIAALQAARGALSSGPPTEQHTPAFAPTTAATAGALVGQGLVVGLPSQPSGADSPPSGRQSGPPSRRWWWAAVAAVVVAGATVAALELSSSKSDVTLPTLTGQSEVIAVARLKALGMKSSIAKQSSVGAPAGAVIAQRPRAGAVVQTGARVLLTVSSGPAVVEVPSVAGMIEANALKALRAVGLEPRVQSQPSRHVRVGYVISTNPPAGLEAVQGTPVTVEVSSGHAGSASKARVHVPNITGLPESAAAAALSSVGLAVGTVTERGSSSQAPGTVLAQTPAGGALLASGGSVALVVAQATTEVQVPDVVGSTRTGAEATLRATGLSPAATTRSVSNPAENGTVLEETPETGEKVKRGETITIVVGTLSEQVTTTTTAPTE